MSSHAPVRLSLSERLVLIAKLPKVLSTLVLYILRRTLQTWRTFSVRALKRHYATSFLCLLNVLTPREMRHLSPITTGDTVRRHCSKNGFSLDSVSLTDTDGFQPATLHFVDCEATGTDPVFIYFHGGGYIAALQALSLAQHAANAAKSKLAVLEYTLAPECPYPGQLAQAAAAIRYLLTNRRYSDIIVGGESAGGNLSLALRTHMQAPKKGITALPSTDTHGGRKLRGVVAISPRTKNGTSSPSFRVNAWKDTIGLKTMMAVKTHWRPEVEIWAAPDLAGKELWEDLRAEKVLLVAGGDEVYKDDIVHTAGLMGADGRYGSAVLVVVCPGETHVQCLSDMAVGVRDGHMTEAVVIWLGSL